MHKGGSTILLVAALVALLVVALTGCSTAVPQAMGSMPDAQALHTNYQTAVSSIQAVGAANSKGDIDGAKSEFTGNFAAAWKVIAPVVRTKDADSYKKLSAAFDASQDEFRKAQPRKGQIEEETDILIDYLKKVGPALGIPATAPVAADPAKLFGDALNALGGVVRYADQDNWAKTRSEFTNFNTTASTLRGQIEANDKALATELNTQVDGLEQSLRPQNPDKATVKAAATGAADSLKKAADKLGIKLA